MLFTEFKSIGEVVKQFQIKYNEADFIIEAPFNIPDYFREDLELVMREGVVDNSEFAICENLIYPVLKEVWKQYRDKFILWSHQSLTYDKSLSGFLEYILAKRSPLGKVVFDRPYLLLVEAKQDKFNEGWGQCLAELIAAQRLNGNQELTLFGIVSNGKFWQFAKLKNDKFTKHIKPHTIYQIDSLFAAINYLFQQCESQLDRTIAD